MARGAVIHDTGVIEHGRRKRAAGHVTGAAILGRRNVVGLGILAGCIDAIVAGITSITHDVRARVIHKCIGKTRRVVAHGTIAGSVLMDGRSGRPGGTQRNVIAIVTRGTIVGDTHMAEQRGHKSGVSMANGTILV